MSASFCNHCSFDDCDIDDEECPYDNFDYEDKCEKLHHRKHHDDDDDDDDDDIITSSILGAAIGSMLGGSHGGFGGFGGGGFGGGGSGGSF